MHSLCRAGAGAAPVDTVTSMTASSLPLNRDGTAVAASGGGSGGGGAVVVDYPGHERVRAGLRGELAGASAVVFVLDSTDMIAQVRQK
jgi:signal recognition particle receptor subunit beta